ncbi:MAG: hypothetical protein IKK21_09025, partial [Clostridia bacterium]|nr:hypothetical protein [Clostridia bacterium]
ILKDPKILILDEATSALDSISEAAIQDALDYIMKDRTSIVIAHRLSTIMSADKILVLADGRIAQCGSHDELLQQAFDDPEDNVYRHLFETQFSKVLEMEKSLPENT